MAWAETKTGLFLSRVKSKVSDEFQTFCIFYIYSQRTKTIAVFVLTTGIQVMNINIYKHVEDPIFCNSSTHQKFSNPLTDQWVHEKSSEIHEKWDSLWFLGCIVGHIQISCIEAQSCKASYVFWWFLLNMDTSYIILYKPCLSLSISLNDHHSPNQLLLTSNHRLSNQETINSREKWDLNTENTILLYPWRWRLEI